MPCDTLAPPIEVLLVDDQRAILAGVAALIESEGPCMRVAGQARSGPEALELARTLQPKVIVLDVDLAGENGLDLIPRFRACCSAQVIVFTCLAELTLRRHALQLGAAGFLAKTSPGEDLITVIHAVTG